MSHPAEPPPPPPSENDRFRALVDFSPDILSIFDSEGRLAFNSAAAWRTHGYRAEDLQGTTTFERIHPEDRSAVETEFAQLLADPTHEARVRYRYRNADGSYTWMEAFARNELANPALQGVIAISRDISDRVEAEQSIRTAEQRFRMLFALSPQPMTIFDLETLRFVEANQAALELYDCSREALLSLSVTEIRPAEELPRFVQILELLRGDRPPGRIENRTRHKTYAGRIIDVDVQAQLIDWLGRKSCLVLLQDITEHLKLHAQLQQTQKLESLGLLAGGIAHDFNNLLTGILGHASVIAEDLRETSSAKESLQLLQEAALRAADLCRQMLAFSGRGRFTVRALELNEFLRSTVDLLRITLRPNIALQFDLAPDLPCIEGDSAQLQQVAMNLVLNAADALGDRGGAIRIATRLVQADSTRFENMHLAPQLPAGAYLELKVADTGCGMNAEVLARIFDPFFTTKFTGRGLGLAAVLGIVRGHRGAIKVESQLGKGTVFTVLFPVSTQAKPALPPLPAAAPPPSAQARTVLVIDDEESVRRTLAAMLRRQNFDLLFAEDGLAGVELFTAQHDRIDLVLLDLTMPRMDGIEALRQIRAIDPAARVLLMSGFDETTESERHGNLGQLGFVQKPFSLQALREKILGAFAVSGPRA